MNHKKKKKHNIKNNHKNLLFLNLCNIFIKQEIIKITLNKARYLKSYIEPIINISKYFNNKNIKFVYSKLKNINSVLKLFKIISIKYLFRSGGYLSLYKIKNRIGDNSNMAIIKFI